MAFRSHIPAGAIAARFRATAPPAADDFGVGAAWGTRIGAGAGAGAGVSSHAATGKTPPDPVSDLDADSGARVEALIRLMVSIWQPDPLAADGDRSRPAWLDASQWAHADAAATPSNRFHALRAAMAASTRRPAWPVHRDDRPAPGPGRDAMADRPPVVLAD